METRVFVCVGWGEGVRVDSPTRIAFETHTTLVTIHHHSRSFLPADLEYKYGEEFSVQNDVVCA